MPLDRKNLEKIINLSTEAGRKISQARDIMNEQIKPLATWPKDWEELADLADDILDEIIDLEAKEEKIENKPYSYIFPADIAAQKKKEQS